MQLLYVAEIKRVEVIIFYVEETLKNVYVVVKRMPQRDGVKLFPVKQKPPII